MGKRRIARKKLVWIFSVVGIILFSLINYPLGAWAGQKIYPFILGVPFSLFYFWAAYSVLILFGIACAGFLWRD